MLLRLAASVYSAVVLGIWAAITAALVWAGIGLSPESWGHWAALALGWAIHSVWYLWLIGYDAIDILLRVFRGQELRYFWIVRAGDIDNSSPNLYFGAS